jgi:hypothetical protein
MSTFQERFARGGDTLARRFDYDDLVVFVADLGPGRDGSVDVVGETAIVVVDDEQYEFELPAGEARGSIVNGVVTVEVDL